MVFHVFVSILLFASAFALAQFQQGPTRSDVDFPKLVPKRSTPRGPYQSPGWVPFGESSEGRLSQEQTNGKSVLGTLKAPKLPHFLPDSVKSKRWFRRAQNADYGYDYPHTGVTRRYNFTITEMNIAPDGVPRPGMVVNGAFPGPTIEANWGDMIEVTVHNKLPHEGTALHWHGLLQHETPYMDGVPGTQQCPIVPGGTFVYKFRADLYGSSFWHSHYSAQYTGGIQGAMVIYGPHDNADYDEDLGPILLNDWYHEDYYDIIEQIMAPASKGFGPPISNNNLIQGKMNYPCVNATADGLSCTPNAGFAKFSVESGKTYRLRIINSGAEGLQKFSIDGAKLTVIANDFVPVKPYLTDVVTLGVGQRSDVLYKATGKPTDAVWMRSTLGDSNTTCTLNDGVSPEAVAAIYYENADTSSIPKTTSSVPHSKIANCLNDNLARTTPFYPLTPGKPETTERIRVTLKSNGTHNLFYMNNSTFRANYNDPVLLDAKLGHTTFPEEYNVHNFGESNSIRLVLENHAVTSAHPMHLHGHNMYVLAWGVGEWDGTITNPQNPQRRDVVLLPNAIEGTKTSEIKPGYAVIQIDADNPGVWPLHCHIAWHVSQGLYISVMEKPQEIQKIDIPKPMAQTCRDWAKWTNTDIPDEIDSGL